jgi:hypothetical protein
VGADHLERTIDRAAVDHDPLELRVGLPADAGGGRREAAAIVQDDGDHADPEHRQPKVTKGVAILTQQGKAVQPLGVARGVELK